MQRYVVVHKASLTMQHIVRCAQGRAADSSHHVYVSVYYHVLRLAVVILQDCLVIVHVLYLVEKRPLGLVNW